MLRKFIFLDTAAGEEIVLPVSPMYQVGSGQNIVSANMTQFGGINLAGEPTAESFSIETMFPAQRYPFVVSGGKADPDYYIEFFERAIQNKTVLRFVISDTPVSMEVLIGSIDYGEQDGTNDVYATLTLYPYRRLQAVTTDYQAAAVQTGAAARTGTAPPVTQDSYEIASGDTLWGICRRFYGDGSLAYKLAGYNGVKNANLIYPGDMLQLPPVDQL